LRKLGLIAGGGDLPIRLASQCQTIGRPLFVIRLKGMADPALKDFDGIEAGIAELGKGFAALKAAGCEAVCLAGVVKRPDFAALKPDWRGLKVLPGAIAAARRGDDALLRFLIGEFEAEGFHVEGAHEVAGGLTLARGPLGKLTPGPDHMSDIHKAFHVAGEIGGEQRFHHEVDDARGRREAGLAGNWLRANLPAIDAVLCSTAVLAIGHSPSSAQPGRA